MIGVRVGVELEGDAPAVASLAATLPWLAPERIQLDENRSLLLLATSFESAGDACDYAERRVRKSIAGMDLEITIESAEAFPGQADLRDSAPAERRSERA
jgi:hypothetical protein